MSGRVFFLVDGFNLYHSILEAEKTVDHALRWLDLRSLCDAHLSSSRPPVAGSRAGARRAASGQAG